MVFGWPTQQGISDCTGAEVQLLGEGNYAIRVVQISQKGRRLDIEHKKEYALGLDAFRDIKIHGPLSLTITGRGVLIKKTGRLETITEQSLRHLFPGFKSDEFYVQHYDSGNQSFVAFIRKEIADPVINTFRKLGIQVLIFSLGPFVVEQVLPLLNNYGDTLKFDGHQVELDAEKNWVDYSYHAGSNSDFEIKLDIQPIQQQFLLAYAAAFQLILNERVETISVDQEQLGAELTELLAKLKFKRNGTMVLFVFFFLLLINFLLFSYFNSANQELVGKAGQRSNQTSDRAKLEEDIKVKERQVALLGWNHGQNYAYLCDQIGQTVPASITLKELNINYGTAKDSMAERKENVETGSISIIGQSANVYVINDWIYMLKQKPWVKTVQLEQYGRDEQKATQVFRLLLKY